ncbi:hypothetical protein PFISCL1PPCAC_5947, partial [Pristionchus fissidentatus]
CFRSSDVNWSLALISFLFFLVIRGEIEERRQYRENCRIDTINGYSKLLAGLVTSSWDQRRRWMSFQDSLHLLNSLSSFPLVVSPSFLSTHDLIKCGTRALPSRTLILVCGREEF